MLKKLFLLLLIFSISNLFSQSKDGYWDTVRTTNQTISLKASEKTYIKTEEFPAGTTEVVVRITLLDDNQQTSSSLVSLLKSIPDPTGISQGTAGTIFLLSKIAGEDKCKYAIFTTSKDAENYVKTGKTINSCFAQTNSVNKDVKLLSENSNCISGKTKNLYIAFESENWVMKEKIILEVVPWVDNNQSRGWNTQTKNEILAISSNLDIIKSVAKKDVFNGYFLEQVTSKYTYKEFSALLPVEKSQEIANFTDKCLTKTGDKKLVLDAIRQKANRFLENKKYEQAINVIQSEIIDKQLATATDYVTLAKTFLLSKQFEKAKFTVTKGIQLDASELQLQLLLAHVYLFTNNLSKAKEIHKKYQSQNVSATTSWINQTKTDFDTFQKNGLNSKDFKKIIRVLN